MRLSLVPVNHLDFLSEVEGILSRMRGRFQKFTQG